MQIIYDKSFEGFLSAIFYVFDRKLTNVSIVKLGFETEQLFGSKLTIETNFEQAERVAKALFKKIGVKQANQFFRVFHNDRDHIESILLDYCRYVFHAKKNVSEDYSHPAVLKIAKIERSINREKHRMEAFVRFRLTKEGIYFACIEPDFDVTPFIVDHFEDRYSDQKWIIYDLKRNYGIHYDLKKTERIEMDFNTSDILNTDPLVFCEDELAFQGLWKSYFKSTNIESRKNMRLHLQHVPKRYWKYLSEKRVGDRL